MTTQHASELLAELLQNLMDVTGEPPEANCSCHLSPPCSDCVDYGSWREVFSACQSAIARATLVAPSTSQPVSADLLKALKAHEAIAAAIKGGA